MLEHERQGLAEKITCLAGEMDVDAVKAMVAQYPGILGWTHLWGETPLLYCVTERQMDAVKLLVELGGDVNAVDDSGTPPLVTCCQMKYLELAKFLLDNGADPDGCDQHENALFHAISSHDASMVELLLNYNANPNVRNFCGVWALFEAIYEKDYAIAELLLARGADPNVDDDTGDSLHYLIYSEMEIEPIPYYDLLAAHHADLLRIGASAKHPLFLAICNGDIEITRYFLSKGMALQAKDEDGDTVERLLRMAGIREQVLG